MPDPTYLTAFDPRRLLAEFPTGDAFPRAYVGTSREALRARQEAMFKRCVARAWTTPFYRRLWGQAGIGEGDIKGLADLPNLPTFDKSDIMASIERCPPFGDFDGRAAYPPGSRPPMVLHTTSGTTGKPQVLLFGPRGREVQNLLLARAYQFQGLRADDIVHSVYGFGMINGGHYVRETVTHWTQAVFLPAGTGVETRSATQVELIRDFGATVIVGFADYIKRLAEVAREAGLDAARDLKVRMISGHIGQEDRAALSAAWGGAEIFDWYGVGDTGIIAGEGPDHDGLYVMEDAHILEIADIDTHRPVRDGAVGDMIVTVLFKDDIYPMIRFNTHDVSRIRPGASAIDIPFNRIDGFLGRSDNMVKLRGINIFPQALAPILEEIDAFAGEFICTAERDAKGRETLTVAIEAKGERPNEALAQKFRELLRRKIGIEVEIELEAPGALAHLTQTETRQKPIRLIDNRAKGPA
jgi:phenylacetate-CoA ligase